METGRKFSLPDLLHTDHSNGHVGPVEAQIPDFSVISIAGELEPPPPSPEITMMDRVIYHIKDHKEELMLAGAAAVAFGAAILTEPRSNNNAALTLNPKH